MDATAGGGGTPPLRILLVGERGAGKTTCCAAAATRLRERGLRPAGVLCPKLVDGAGRVTGIEILDLLPDPPSRRVLARTDQALAGPRTGAYRFSEEAFRFGRLALEEGARRGDVLFADEVGPLEMRGEGLSNIFALARSPAPLPMVLVVRTSLVSELAERLHPTPVTVLELPPLRGKETSVRLLELLGPHLPPARARWGSSKNS